MVTKIKGVNEIGSDSNENVESDCQTEPENVESNCQAEPGTVTEIKAIEEIRGESNSSRKNGKVVDAEKEDLNSLIGTNPDTETIGMRERRGESSSPCSDRGLSEESAGAEKADSGCQRAPQLAMELTRVEEMGSLSSFGQNNCKDKSQGNQSCNAEHEDSNVQGAFNMVTEIEGTEGHSNADVKLLCKEGADTKKLENNSQRAPSIAAEITAIEEIRPESIGSSKVDENVDVEKADDNDSMGSEGESSCAEKINFVNGITGIEVESNIAEEITGDKPVYQESTNTEKAESQGRRASSDMVGEIKWAEEMDGESDGTDKGTDGNLTCDERKCVPNIFTEVNGLEGESYGVEKIDIVTGITGIEVESNGAEEISNEKPVYLQSTNTAKIGSQGQRVSAMVAEIKGIEETDSESDGTDKRTDGNLTCEERNCLPNIVTEINGLAGESDGAKKINIVTEITGIEFESNGAEEVSGDKQEHLTTEKTESQGQSVSHMVGEGVEETEGESDGTDKMTDGNSTCEERNADKVANSSSPVHKGETLCSIDAVAFGNENLISSIDDVQSVGNRVFETISNDEIGRGCDGDKDIDDKAKFQRDEVSENLHTDGMGSEGMSTDPELPHDTSILANSRLSKVENSFTSTSRDLSTDDAIASGNETCNTYISHGQSPPDMVQVIIGKPVGSESDGVDITSDDKLTCEEIEDDTRFNCSSAAAEGMSGNTVFSQGLSTLNSQCPVVGRYCASSTKEVSFNDAAAAKNEALNSCVDDSQVGPNSVGGVENLGGELNGADNSINSQTLNKNCKDSEKSYNSGSDIVGVPNDAEFSNDASSIKEVCRDVVCGNTLNDPVHDSKMVPATSIAFAGIKKEGMGSSDADQTSDESLLRESEDADKLPSINIVERVSCNAEICDDQTTLADLECSQAGNASASSSIDVAISDAVAFGNETLTCPIEIDQEPANMSVEIAGPQEKGDCSDRSNDNKLICEAGTGVMGDGSDMMNDAKLIREQSGGANISNNKEVLTTLAECSSVDAVAVKDMNGSAAKGFFFLIRMPRFDDEKLRERIRVAELNVDEKTQCRDAFRQKIRNKRANCQTHGAEFESAKTQERDARKQVRTKRADISTLQDVIDKAKNAVAIEEIDSRICNMEHIIGHETLPLKEEKLLIREIKQLKQLRGQISSNIGSQDEVQKALDERDINEEQLRILKKELESLKLKVSKAETIAKAASRKYEDESRKLKELQTQFKAADDIRQEAYEELRNLKKGFYEKNIHFRTYKDEATLAGGYARQREMGALNHLCINQVESYMELWNKNDDFRKEYIRCNTRSTIRRFGTLDARTLGPDEEPTVLPSYAAERVDRLVANVDKVKFVSQIPVSQQVKQVVVFKDETKDEKIMVQAAEGMNQIEKAKEARKPIQKESSVVDEPKAVGHLQTAQELEAARKEEELRKLEAEARLKEQRRLEEIAKAKEALERKRRNAEKAQQRAELRAQKEEEQRLKEREKRLRKKERKKVAVGENESNDGETALISTSPKGTVNEPEATESPQTTKKPQKPSQYTKQIKTKSSIPPPLRNRSRRKLQQWLWLTLSCMIVIALFFLGNIGFFSNLKPRRGPGF